MTEHPDVSPPSPGQVESLENETTKEKEQVLNWLSEFLQPIETAAAQGKPFVLFRTIFDSKLFEVIPNPGDYDVNSYRDLVLYIKGLIRTIILSEEVEVLRDRKTNKKMIGADGFEVSIKPPWLIYTRDDSFIDREIPKNNKIEIYARSIPDVNDSIAEGVFSTNSFEIEKPKSKELESETYSLADLVDSLKIGSILTIDGVLSWPLNKIKFCMEKKEGIIDGLMKEFCDQTQELVRLGNLIAELRKYEDDGSLVQEARSLVPHELRELLADYKQETCRDAVNMLRARLLEKNKARYGLHRIIESFCLIFDKKSKEFVAVELESRLTPASDKIPVSGLIFGRFVESYKLSINSGKTLEIVFGISSGYSVGGYMNDLPASDNTYKSLINMARTREDDIALVQEIQDNLQARFPLLKMLNDVVEYGSFHEKWAGGGLLILSESLTSQAVELKISKESLIQEIVQVVKEKVEKVE